MKSQQKDPLEADVEHVAQAWLRKNHHSLSEPRSQWRNEESSLCKTRSVKPGKLPNPAKLANLVDCTPIYPSYLSQHIQEEFTTAPFAEFVFF